MAMDCCSGKGGTLSCSMASSSAMSAGNRSRRVDSIWPNFMKTGPSSSRARRRRTPGQLRYPMQAPGHQGQCQAAGARQAFGIDELVQPVATDDAENSDQAGYAGHGVVRLPQLLQALAQALGA